MSTDKSSGAARSKAPIEVAVDWEAPEDAFALAQRFAFHFTPKSASWLNMIEIEFSALSRQCLNRRIPSLEILEREVLTLVQEREEKAITINWQYYIEKARTTFKNHYDAIRKS